MDSLDKRPKPGKMDIRFVTWNARSLYRAGLLMTVAKEISKYFRFNGSTGDQMGQRWHRTRRQSTFFYGKWNENHE
jgi:hypothetical protein